LYCVIEILLTIKKINIMPLNDLIQLHYTAAEIAAIDPAFTTIENTIFAKSKNLTPEERNEYGSINEQNKLHVNKVRDYRNTQPALSSPDVNWVEYEADWQDRNFLETRMQRLASLNEMMKDAKILHDHDNYKNALVDHAYTQYKAETEATGGYTTKYEELKQFFPNTGGTGGGSSTPPTP
jgi:patatin-like phospholipase/acyl hydrolase